MKLRKKFLIIAFVLLQTALVIAISFLEEENSPIGNSRFILLFYLLVIIIAIGFAWYIIKEINLHKTTEQNLQHYEDLVDHTQIIIRNMHDEIVSWNKGMEKLYGWTKKEALGRSSHQLFEAVFPRQPEDIKKYVLFNNQWRGELRHRRKDGSWFNVSSHWALIRDEEGHPAAIMETIEDITQLKQVEQQVTSLSREINQSHDAIYTIDQDQIIKTWNKGAEKLYGFSSEEALGQHSNLLLQTVISPAETARIFDELADQDYYTREVKRTTKQGDDIYVYASVSTLRNDDDEITGYIGVSFNITEQRMLREQVNYLANLVDQSAEAIVSVTLEGTILSWNSGAESLYGYSTNEAVGRNITILVPPEYNNDEQELIGKILDGQPVQQYETQRMRKDGSRLIISVTVYPIKNIDQNIVAVAGMARNISERKEIEQKIIQSEENLIAIFENTADGFILTNREGLVKVCNGKAYEYTLSYLKEEIVPGRNIFDDIKPGRKIFLTKIFSSVLQGKMVQYDRSYKNNNDDAIWLNLIFNPIKNNNLVTGVCITIRNITHQKKAEQQKEFDRNNLTALINNTNDLMWSVGLDFTLITSNHAFDQMQQQLRGIADANEHSRFLNKHEDELQLRYKKCYERAFAGETFKEISYNTQPFEHWSEDSFYPIYEAGKVSGTACFSRDITIQKKAAELLEASYQEKLTLGERMSTILNTLPANIALLNDKSVIIDVNNAWRNFADDNRFQGTDYGIGRNYIKVAEDSFGEGGDDGKKVAAGIKSILENREKEFVFEYPCHSVKVRRWFRMVVTPLKDKAYAGAVMMHFDISELKHLEEERLHHKLTEQKKTAKAMLQAQEKERNLLGRDLHDNICQVLAALKMKLNYCVDANLVDIPLIKECIKYLEEAIIETRDISHRMILPRFAESTLTDALQALSHTYTHEKRNVILESSQVEQDLPIAVKETLYRIAQENLNNIDKYANASSVKVMLSARHNHVSLTIEDNGIGFDAVKQKSGTGIKNIMNRAESLNGSAQIISSPGKGCRLMVEIPLT